MLVDDRDVRPATVQVDADPARSLGHGRFSSPISGRAALIRADPPVAFGTEDRPPLKNQRGAAALALHDIKRLPSGSAAPGCEVGLISLSALGSAQRVRGSCLGFSLITRGLSS